jgi:hypothetical protein
MCRAAGASSASYTCGELDKIVGCPRRDGNLYQGAVGAIAVEI